MLDRVVLRRIRRVVRYPDLDPDPIDQPLQVRLEQVLVGAVAPAAVAPQQDGGRSGVERSAPALPPPLYAVAGERAGVVAGAQVHVTVVPLHVVKPVRDDHARGDAGEVVIERLDRLRSVEAALSVAVSHQLLLLRIDAQERVVRLQILLLEPGDVLELPVAVGRLPHRPGLAGLPLDVYSTRPIVAHSQTSETRASAV